VYITVSVYYSITTERAKAYKLYQTSVGASGTQNNNTGIRAERLKTNYCRPTSKEMIDLLRAVGLYVMSNFTCTPWCLHHVLVPLMTNIHRPKVQSLPVLF